MKKLLNIAILFGVVAVIGGAITVHYKGKGVTVTVPKAGIKIEIEKLVSEMENRLLDADTKVADFEDYVSGIQARSVKRSQGIRNLDTQIGRYDRLIAGYESELTYVKSRVERGEVVRTASTTPRVLTPDELMVLVEQKRVQIRTARQGKDQLEAERAFLREELKKDEIELHTAPLQLLELQGSLANLRLLRDLHKDRLTMIDDFRAPDAEAETQEEEKRRIASDFLTYKNDDGKFADFHCLRHTFITNLGRAKVSPKTAQTLARHSDISLTMNIYSHVSEEDQIEAINALPGIPGTEKPDDEDENGACVPA